MSTYWDIVCLDCEIDGKNESAGWHWNHGEQELAAILAQKDKIAAAWPMFEVVGGTDLRIGFPESGGSVEAVRFFAMHHQHRLAVMNEYGDVLDECLHRWNCGDCNHGLVCHRPKGHDGAHDTRRDPPTPAIPEAVNPWDSAGPTPVADLSRLAREVYAAAPPPMWWCEKHWQQAFTREPCGCPQAARVHLQSVKTRTEGPRTAWVTLTAMGER